MAVLRNRLTTGTTSGRSRRNSGAWKLLSTQLVVTLFLMLLAAWCRADTVTGLVEKVTTSGLSLARGGTFGRHPNVKVKLPNEADGAWSDIKVGDQVEITHDGEGRIYRLWIKGRASAGRFEQSLFDLTVVSGGFERYREASVSGRSFARAAVQSVYKDRPTQETVYRLDQPYDELSLWVGFDDGYDFARRGQVRVAIKADDEVVYTSEALSRGDKAEHVVVPLTGVTSVTIITSHVGTAGSRSAIGDPVLVRFPKQSFRLLSPADKATIDGATALTWQSAPGATGYLLELQCVSLASTGDAATDARFVTKRIGLGETSFSFDPGKMPKGTWRWRVHALSARGFLVELKEWRTFTSK